MGFQLVEAVAWGDEKQLLVFNSQYAIDLTELKLERSNEPVMILRNGLRIVELLKSPTTQTIFSAPEIGSFRLSDSRIASVAGASTSATPAPSVALPSSLVKHVTLGGPRVFHRFSAYNPDRRVDPVTGSFLPGTYAAPESEVPFVPTGFLAVGRFALPNNLPASHHYETEASGGTSVDFGTVAPAFGQAGGGVEAYFAGGAVNARIPPTPPSTLPDE